MKLKINKSGVDVNDKAFSYIIIESYIEELDKSAKIRSICYKEDTSEIIIPSNWKIRGLNLTKLNSLMMEEKDTEDFYINHFISCLTSYTEGRLKRHNYKMDVYELDEISGDPKKDKETGKNIIKFKFNEPILKENGNFIYNRPKYSPFCEYNQIEIINK